jgi:hypothetical protein
VGVRNEGQRLVVRGGDRANRVEARFKLCLRGGHPQAHSSQWPNVEVADGRFVSRGAFLNSSALPRAFPFGQYARIPRRKPTLKPSFLTVTIEKCLLAIEKYLASRLAVRRTVLHITVAIQDSPVANSIVQPNSCHPLRLPTPRSCPVGACPTKPALPFIISHKLLVL